MWRYLARRCSTTKAARITRNGRTDIESMKEMRPEEADVPGCARFPWASRQFYAYHTLEYGSLDQTTAPEISSCM